MIAPQSVGDALDELGVCLWADDGKLRSVFDVWRDCECKLQALEDGDQAWALLGSLCGPDEVAAMRQTGRTFGQVLVAQSSRLHGVFR